ncbi:MAG: type VI secretion system protein TssA [Steroidobacteraceae bacterium]
MQAEASSLVAPISSESPCGADLDESQPLVLAAFDGYRVFGQMAPWAKDKQPDWREIRDRSLEVLGTSKDLRVLTHLAAAGLRIDGVAPFTEAIKSAASWLDAWWDQVYPRVDEDAILRRNALNGLADRVAVVDGLRRAPLLAHRQLGTYCIRDIEIAQGEIAPGPDEPPRSASDLDALLSALETEALASIALQLREAAEGLRAIETTMRDRGGTDAAPDFSAPMRLLVRTQALLDAQLASRAPAGAGIAEGGSDGAHATSGPRVPGAIGTRNDALKALDAVAAFFRSSEPSSPVPLFIERAKRLVGKDFLAVLEDVVPDSVAQAKSIGGVREAE